MPILRIKEIRDMSSENRKKRLGELRTELVRLKTMIRAGGTVENPARLKQLRRAIARVLTIEREQELGLGKVKKKEKKAK
jgi:large subunit ribosomal protein L29